MKHLKLINLTLKTIALLAIAFFIGSFAAYSMGAPDLAIPAGTALTAFCLIPRGSSLKASFFSITATDIVTEWGQLYREQGQGMKDIMVKLRTKAETEAIFKRRITTQTIMEKASSEYSRVLQRFQKAFTPIGGVTFKPRKINLYRLKIDSLETPDDLYETWLGFLADNNLDRKAWPFSIWHAQQLIAQSQADYEKSEIFGGVPGVVTAGTATVAGTSVLGIRKQLNDANTAGQSLTLTMGAVPTDALLFVKYIEDMTKLAQSTNEELWAEIDQWNMNKTLMRRFMEGMRLKYNMNYNQTDTVTVIDTSVKIVGLNSHASSTKIWATPMWNREAGIKAPDNQNVFKVENVDRTVKFYTDFMKGVGFWIPEYIYQNDVDLV